MSAIDELCQLLDERNEEYDIRDNSGGTPSYVMVCWFFNLADRAYFYGYPDGHTKLVTYRYDHDLTPEQAIAATLGASDATDARQGDADLAAENAKLRELLDYITPIAWYASSERERDRMRELGVEVES